MKKVSTLATLSATLVSVALFSACGENTTTEKIVEVATGGVNIVESVGNLPKCTKDNEGEQALVKGESSVRVCVDGKWFGTKDSSDDLDFSCSTKELKDKSGLKIVCNGDSIGVVLNGEKGETGKDGEKGDAGADGKNGENGSDGKAGKDGDDGASCTVAGRTDSTISIKCGEKSLVLDLRAGGAVVDTSILDSEMIAVPMDSLAGFSQKGPFLKGSTVYLYELSDGRTLKQTNGNFVSYITRDDGHYKFTSRELRSQYALIMVNGKYRNEVTGNLTATPIQLSAYTNMLSRKFANVNLLTHLEKDRVFYLVTKLHKRVVAAKKQAQSEIFKQFYIDTTGFKKESEDLDLFGKTDADGALLAISILLQGDRDESEMMALLTEISNDMETDGEWNGNGADSVKAAMALWALNNHGRLGEFRKNVESWGLGKAPSFERYIKNFSLKALGFIDCEASNEGMSLTIDNKYSPFYGQTFVCKNGNYEAIRPEKTHFNPDIHYGEMIDMRDHKVYRTVDIGKQTWMAENLDFADTLVYPALKKGMKCLYDKKENCEKYGRYYSYGVAIDSLLVYGDGAKDCALGTNANSCHYNYPVRGICPEGWHLPSGDEWRVLWMNVGSTIAMVSKDTIGTDDFGFSAIYSGYYGNGFSMYYSLVAWWLVPFYGYGGQATYLQNNLMLNLSAREIGGSFAWTASSDYFFPIRCLKDTEHEYGLLIDERDNHQYKTIEIGGKTWMAENLNYKPGDDSDTSSFCLNEDPTNCDKYGRYYYKDSIQSVCPKGWHLPDSTEWWEVFYAHGRSNLAMQSMSEYATNSLGLGLLPMNDKDRGVGYIDTVGKTGAAFVWGDGVHVELSTSCAVNLPNEYLRLEGKDCGGCPVRCVQD